MSTTGKQSQARKIANWLVDAGWQRDAAEAEIRKLIVEELRTMADKIEEKS